MTTAKPSKLRLDARLLQILAGVRRGDIAVEDAALEIIEGRGLDRRSFLADTKWGRPFFERDDLMDSYNNIYSRCLLQPVVAPTAAEITATADKILADIYKKTGIPKRLLGMPVVTSANLEPDKILLKPSPIISWDAGLNDDVSVCGVVKNVKS